MENTCRGGFGRMGGNVQKCNFGRAEKKEGEKEDEWKDTTEIRMDGREEDRWTGLSEGRME